MSCNFFFTWVAMSRSQQPAFPGGEPVFPDGPPAWPLQDPDVAEALQRAWADGSWGKYHGDYCTKLQQALAEYHDCEHVILTCSGTAAVELALRGVNVQPHSEVLLAAYEFSANFANTLLLDATPVLVDVRPDDWQLDATQLPAAFSGRTAAVLVSHLHGGLVDMPAVLEFARSRNLPVIEDACQTPGGMIDGSRCGSAGDVGVLSFGGSKLLTAGRGGAVLTNDAHIAQRIKLYTERGNSAYPLSELQAAVLLPQLARLDELNQQRTASVTTLRKELADIDGLQLFACAQQTRDATNNQPVYYKVGIQYDAAKFHDMSRDQFSRAARAEGIALDPGFRSLHKTHSRRRYRSVNDLPSASVADDNVLVLHHPVLLESADTMEKLAAALKKVPAHTSG